MVYLASPVSCSDFNDSSSWYSALHDADVQVHSNLRTRVSEVGRLVGSQAEAHRAYLIKTLTDLESSIFSTKAQAS
jgi:hypothetical protein